MATESSPPLSTTETVPPPTSAAQTSDPQGQFSAAVDDLLDQLQHKFDGVSREMFGKLDDMARRLDELEASFTVVDGTTGTGTGTASATGSNAGTSGRGSPEK
ncbi:hypothetical protein BO78DRAFT_393581 [Aspergillus sclerotiicarbonarius CBS 121057]|uniref:Heat shock factor binding protein 1-domain-containing protein n=1 Tax=Aspergillus sclerotiicarbonarius (strain CBS 121057 / IBT 28362) TaxID=1448318 RepID=A0A319EN40_ASPSB|nr:hypothetical protein BO78DRAFT_393581 [Aspergillus sclerotiicarbonarius CBS 121057]